MTIKTAKKRKTIQSTTKLRKIAWKLNSELTRRKERGRCYTCGKRGIWKYCHAGHFIHKDCMDFVKENIHCQCVGCNKFRHGNPIAYAIKLETQYGPGIIQRLKKQSEATKNWKIDELLELIEHYKVALAELKKTTP
jgi:hypothetical protein